ncbi:hypothetical protein MTsPCn9_35130 [Croceitalea sp. MTPC9]|nr:hypothetical protein MTsPCn6_35020 [Croceitalea sp. MTPC6]GMN18573.1 hypothetical protein MTsPCn9_35130 [Croceitalea sp. MTPC9]
MVYVVHVLYLGYALKCKPSVHDKCSPEALTCNEAIIANYDAVDAVVHQVKGAHPCARKVNVDKAVEHARFDAVAGQRKSGRTRTGVVEVLGFFVKGKLRHELAYVKRGEELGKMFVGKAVGLVKGSEDIVKIIVRHYHPVQDVYGLMDELAEQLPFLLAVLLSDGHKVDFVIERPGIDGKVQKILKDVIRAVPT